MKYISGFCEIQNHLCTSRDNRMRKLHKIKMKLHFGCNRNKLEGGQHDF